MPEGLAALALCWALAGGPVPEARGEVSALLVRVLDPAKKPLPGARVELTGPSGESWSRLSDPSGEASFERLPPGSYRLEIAADGFEPQRREAFALVSGSARIEIRMKIARRFESVDVHGEVRRDAFTKVLTSEQIALLPDDPEEMEAALLRMAGPGAVIRVNGLSGGRLPPKSQIWQIRIRTNAFAAEHHQPGQALVDVLTRPGSGVWGSRVRLGARHEALDARDPLAERRGAGGTYRLGLELEGPLAPQRTSAALSASLRTARESKPVVRVPAEGRLGALVVSSLDTLELSARLEHLLGPAHTVRGQYQLRSTDEGGLGSGSLDAAERAYSRGRTEHLLQVSHVSSWGTRVANDLRLDAQASATRSRPSSREPALDVLGSFRRGGFQAEGRRALRRLQLADDLDLMRGRHALRAGFLLELERHDVDERTNAAGTFTFASPEDFARGRPTTFTQQRGDPRFTFNHVQFGGYVQDEMPLGERLALGLGLRHEVQTHLGDGNNLGPRLSLAWSAGRTTCRFGAGIFHDWLDAGTAGEILRLDGKRNREVILEHPGFPDPFEAGVDVTPAPGRRELGPRLRMPQLWQLSVEVARTMGPLQASASYSAQQGTNRLRSRNVNVPGPAGERPDRTAGNVFRLESSARSSLHSLRLDLFAAPPSGRFSANVVYLLSRSIDEADGPLGLPANSADLRGERGPAASDRRHVLFGFLLLRLPAGLQLGADFSAMSGLPYDVTTGRDDNGDTISNDRPPGATRNSARGAGYRQVSARLGWRFGPARTPRAVSVERGDTLSFGSGPSAQRRFEAHVRVNNLFNHPNWSRFVGVQTSPLFGRAVSALPMRRFELGLSALF